jgi:putative SOS response-associated peptidase YedK
MCGRFVLNSAPKVLAELFQLADVPDILQPRYNIAPSQLIAAVGRKADSHARGLTMMSWGFVPRWAKSPKDGMKPINARAETIRTNGVFRASFKDRRCLIPASGYYEWQKPAKEPYYIHPKDGGMMAFAGLWDSWKGETEPLLSCTIITVAANDTTSEFHDRMPAIVLPEDFDAWLDLPDGAEQGMHLLRSAPEDYLTCEHVSRLVNSPRNQGPECILPVA